MEKTETAKNYLVQAFKLLEGHAFGEARYKISGAIKEIEKIEDKRAKRVDLQTTIADQWKQKLQNSAALAQAPQESLDQIEKLIDAEKKKMDKTGQTKPQTFLG